MAKLEHSVVSDVSWDLMLQEEGRLLKGCLWRKSEGESGSPTKERVTGEYWLQLGRRMSCTTFRRSEGTLVDNE